MFALAYKHAHLARKPLNLSIQKPYLTKIISLNIHFVKAKLMEAVFALRTVDDIITRYDFAKQN